MFEVWNLLVIGGALIGFNYVPFLASSPATFWAIWAAVVGTVVVTGYSVFTWDQGMNTDDRLALDFDAFISEHRRCGDLAAGVDPPEVRPDCQCGGCIIRPSR